MPLHRQSGSHDFELRCRGEITAEEYCRRLEQRIRDRQEQGAPIRTIKDFAARFTPKSFRICRHCRGTGVER